MRQKVLVFGASTNPDRYAFKALNLLLDYDHEVIAFGRRKGEVRGVEIQDVLPEQIEGLDTITLYMGPQNQTPYYDYLVHLKPKRVIFNPETENPELMSILKENGIASEVACTLVLLHTDQFELAS